MLVSELRGGGLMLPRTIDALGLVGAPHLRRDPGGPVGRAGVARRHLVDVHESVSPAVREPPQQGVVLGSHHPIVGPPCDGLCHSRRVDFTVTAAQFGERWVVTGTGELDVHSAPVLQAELDPLSTRQGTSIIVDLSAVGFIDSTGLGVLVTALKHVRESQGTLDVVVSSHRVMKVFTITGLDAVIPLHATLDEVLPPA